MLTAILILASVALVAAVGLGVASRVFAVEVDPVVEQINELLPGVNCGACGNPGCHGYAELLAAGKADVNDCPVCSADNRRAIADLLHLEFSETVRDVAFVHCGGTREHAKDIFEYAGIQTCKAAHMLGGPLGCRYGCLGYGDCLAVCLFDAIVIEDGVARILPERCTSCGQCVAACPRDLIDLQPAHQKVLVNCSTHGRGKAVSVNCKVGCIGCGRCVKACPTEAITMDNLLPVIDADKCILCGQCARVCPTHSILDEAGPHWIARINENCTGCTLCAPVCPADAIAGERKSRHEVDPKKCVRCDKCYATCDFEAIEMVDEDGAIRMEPRPKKTKKRAEATS
ncbi:MAG: RnfABCDGE type electron transport complex subunit B [Candidatus Lernaella stagnicola]|nr:RnfABCDGE type electron transport complex subunit B [Candidatus Lernaella stagnicola]